MDAVKLHTVFITYNRLELTKKAIETYLETVSIPDYYVNIVDNGSTDGTVDWFFDRFNHERVLLTPLGENKYPGYATNMGWKLLESMYPATHLHRADNDYGFLPGWCEEVERKFKNEKIGQVGLRTGKQEPGAPYNVGGNCVIRRELWDAGLRYDETPWPQMTPGFTEDSYFSPAVEKMGYRWTRVNRQCIYELEAVHADTNTDPYYERSWGDRHIHGRTPQ